MNEPPFPATPKERARVWKKLMKAKNRAGSHFEVDRFFRARMNTHLPSPAVLRQRPSTALGIEKFQLEDVYKIPGIRRKRGKRKRKKVIPRASSSQNLIRADEPWWKKKPLKDTSTRNRSSGNVKNRPFARYQSKRALSKSVGADSLQTFSPIKAPMKSSLSN